MIRISQVLDRAEDVIGSCVKTKQLPMAQRYIRLLIDKIEDTMDKFVLIRKVMEMCEAKIRSLSFSTCGY